MKQRVEAFFDVVIGLPWWVFAAIAGYSSFRAGLCLTSDETWQMLGYLLATLVLLYGTGMKLYEHYVTNRRREARPCSWDLS